MGLTATHSNMGLNPFHNNVHTPAFALPVQTVMENTFSYRSTSFTEQEISWEAKQFLHNLHRNISLERGALDLKPLNELFDRMILEQNEIIKQVLKKSSGYFYRLFSNESWEEWLESRTPLGKVVNVFVNYLKSRPSARDRLLNHLDVDAIQRANTQAEYLLKQLSRSQQETDPLSFRSDPVGNDLSIYGFSMRTFQVLKSGFFLMDDILSRALNFLPGAKAQSPTEESSLEKCTGEKVIVALEATREAIKRQNPDLILAVEKLYSPFFAQCLREETYKIVKAQHDAELKFHEKKIQEFETEKKGCAHANGRSYCYDYKDESRPKMAPHIVTVGPNIGNWEWKVTHGYLSWSIHVSTVWKLYLGGFKYASDSYNYNTNTAVAIKDET